MKRLVLIVLCNILIINVLLFHLKNTSVISAMNLNEALLENEVQTPEAQEINFLINVKTLCTLTCFMALRYSLEGCYLRFDSYLDNCQHSCLYSLLQAIDILDLKLYKKSYDQPCYSVVLYEAYLILNYITQQQPLMITHLDPVYEVIISDIGHLYENKNDAELVIISYERLNLLFQAIKAYLFACLPMMVISRTSLEQESLCVNIIACELAAERFTGFEHEHFRRVYNFIKSYSHIGSVQEFFENSFWLYKYCYIEAMRVHAWDRYRSS
jgi:hypothetical protein